MSDRVQFPKFEFSDLLHKKTVVPGHDFQPKDDPSCSNIVQCSKCGLEGWLVWDYYEETDIRVASVKSYKPDKKCEKVQKPKNGWETEETYWISYPYCFRCQKCDKIVRYLGSLECCPNCKAVMKENDIDKDNDLRQ